MRGWGHGAVYAGCVGAAFLTGLGPALIPILVVQVVNAWFWGIWLKERMR